MGLGKALGIGALVGMAFSAMSLQGPVPYAIGVLLGGALSGAVLGVVVWKVLDLTQG
ncbi:MAG: hypothetical protein GWN84_21220 [Gammaproteobacteria bacterium]|nr:hypothetical protein [Gammaproteobacteria bacterium]NIR98717.1 hypothetical protein [Gammaproteobacteria bacterium]NIV20849.1 hypothetical protein [Gammaproteobacteria bacterium]